MLLKIFDRVLLVVGVWSIDGRFMMRFVMM